MTHRRANMSANFRNRGAAQNVRVYLLVPSNIEHLRGKGNATFT